MNSSLPKISSIFKNYSTLVPLFCHSVWVASTVFVTFLCFKSLNEYFGKIVWILIYCLSPLHLENKWVYNTNCLQWMNEWIDDWIIDRQTITKKVRNHKQTTNKTSSILIWNIIININIIIFISIIWLPATTFQFFPINAIIYPVNK